MTWRTTGQAVLVPVKIMEQILLETIRHMENKEVTGDSQHDFTKSKWCLANLVGQWMDGQRLDVQAESSDKYS